MYFPFPPPSQTFGYRLWNFRDFLASIKQGNFRICSQINSGGENRKLTEKNFSSRSCLEKWKNRGGIFLYKTQFSRHRAGSHFFEVQHAQEHHIQKTTTCILSCQVFTHANAANSLLDNVTLYRWIHWAESPSGLVRSLVQVWFIRKFSTNNSLLFLLFCLESCLWLLKLTLAYRLFVLCNCSMLFLVYSLTINRALSGLFDLCQKMQFFIV